MEGTEHLKIKLSLALTGIKDLVVNFSKVEGNFFYFRKVVA